MENIQHFVERVYFAYFGMKLGHQNKPWAPQKFVQCVLKYSMWKTVLSFCNTNVLKGAQKPL